MCSFLYGHQFSTHLGKCLGVRLLGCIELCKKLKQIPFEVAVNNLLLIACLFLSLFPVYLFSSILLPTAYVMLLSELLHETSHLGFKWFKVWRNCFYVCTSEAVYPSFTVLSSFHLLFFYCIFLCLLTLLLILLVCIASMHQSNLQIFVWNILDGF